VVPASVDSAARPARQEASRVFTDAKRRFALWKLSMLRCRKSFQMAHASIRIAKNEAKSLFLMD
jgi:hypothetical protein